MESVLKNGANLGSTKACLGTVGASNSHRTGRGNNSCALRHENCSIRSRAIEQELAADALPRCLLCALNERAAEAKRSVASKSMSAIYPTFEHPIADADGFNGNALSRHLKQLDEIAVATRVMPLSRFIDSHTMAYNSFDDDQLAGMKVPAIAWFRIEQGLQTLRTILESIQRDTPPFESRRGDETEAVSKELKELETLLASVANDDNRFHLLIDI